MRAFLAIDLDDTTKDKLEKIADKVMKSGIEGKKAERDKLHLTVKFLGNITEEQCDKTKHLLSDFVSQTKSFDIELKGIGAFPDTQTPEIVWAGSDSKELISLLKNIDKILTPLNTRREFNHITPHVTLVRGKKISNMNLLQKTIKDLKDMTIAKQEIGTMSLYKSTPTPKGHVYSRVWSLSLKR